MPAFDVVGLMHDAVTEILNREDYPSFIDWFTGQCFDEMEKLGMDDGQQGRTLGTTLGRVIWNATPLRSNAWRPATIRAHAAQKRNSSSAARSSPPRPSSTRSKSGVL
jgi:hypothetical protein